MDKPITDIVQVTSQWFTERLRAKGHLEPGARVIMGGHQYRGEHRDPGQADYYSLRTCDNGQTFKLVDNIPEERLVASLLGSRGALLEYTFKHYGEREGWWVKYEVTA